MPSPIMRFFEYSHLPEKLQAVSSPIATVASVMENSLPDCAEKSAGLRKLLEAKDCFIRAALPTPQTGYMGDTNGPGTDPEVGGE